MERELSDARLEPGLRDPAAQIPTWTAPVNATGSQQTSATATG